MAKETTRKTHCYPTDVSDEEWEFCVPYLSLMNEEAPQREHSLRAIFNALRWMVRAGCPWRLLPHDLPPWMACINKPCAGFGRDVLRRWPTS